VFGFAPFLPHEMFLPCGPEFPDEEAWGISASGTTDAGDRWRSGLEAAWV